MSEQEAVKQFIDQIRWLYEPEFGDFKRKVGLYIQRLEESLPAGKNDAKQAIANMKTTVVFNPNGDIESTRRQVLLMAQELLLDAASGVAH